MRIPEDQQTDLLAKAAKAVGSVASHREYAFEINDGFLNIDELEFFGPCSCSPNGRFVLGFLDGMLGMGGRWRSGRYVLLEGRRLMLAGKLQRPNDGRVSNSGVFILSDWLFKKDQLAGVFHVFSPTGQALVRRRYRANLGATGISDEGDYAACSCCVSPYEAHDGLVSVFDLSSKTQIGGFQPPMGILGFEFDVARRMIRLISNYDQRYSYTFDGRFLDEVRWQQERVRQASGYELIQIAGELLDRSEGACAADADQAVNLLLQALEKGISEYTQAQVHKTIGKLYVERGDKAKGIQHFEKAIALRPKIGLKQYVKRLRDSS